MNKNISIKTIVHPCRLLCLPGFFLLLSLNMFAQFTVKLRVKTMPAVHAGDAVFAAGNFNGWNPGDGWYTLLKKDKYAELTLKNLSAGNYQFKFTRGSWEQVESTASGADVGNRQFDLVSDTLLEYSIAAWMDDFDHAEKTHTASANVQVVDTAFAMPQLGRNRRVWIYLPPGYSTSNKHYPVIYMHDGQNLFDKFTSGYGEWGVDEWLDSMIANGRPACIVVGIDNGGETRMSEYNPYPFTWKDSTNSKSFAAEGDAYVDFLSQTLKPFIDKHYRTLPGKENTAVAGSSMGGLISLYTMLKYPLQFGKAGIFSPAFWTAPALDDFTDAQVGKLSGKLFFYMGGQEGKTYIDDMIRIQEKLGKNSSTMIYSIIDPQGKHNEAAWNKWFEEFYKWIWADGYNVITKEGD